VISGFRREADENRSLLSYCAASSGNSLPTFWDNRSRKVGKELLNRAEAHSSLTLGELHNVFLNYPPLDHGIWPVPVAVRSKASICGRSLAGVVVSKNADSMDICLS
jgi:hypothetical protein